MMARAVCIISLTPVTDEPRVLRQSQAMADAGWSVTVAGFKGRQEPPPYWDRFVEVQHVLRVDGPFRRRFMQAKGFFGQFVPNWAEDYYWWSSGYEGIYQHIAYVEEVKSDFVIGHDYFTAPIAARLARKNGAIYSIDAHEYSRGQYMHDARWRWLVRPWVHAMQRRFLPKAAVITTVCDGIADLLQKENGLAERPVVVRSTARFRDMAFKPTRADRIDVLYHGILAPARGLEDTIASVPLWRPEFRFIIRGPGPEDYIDGLKALIAKHRVQERVTIDPPVPAGEMVREANKSDIGFFVQPDLSPQKRFTLPNKFFEYIAAGLALCVADLPEMARLVGEHDLGRLVGDLRPEAIAAEINALTPETIDAYKKHSLNAARLLSWDNEAKVMMAAYEAAMAGR